jgi:hypothetical protein
MLDSLGCQDRSRNRSFVTKGFLTLSLYRQETRKSDVFVTKAWLPENMQV